MTCGKSTLFFNKDNYETLKSQLSSEIFVIDNVATDSFQIQGHYSNSGHKIIKITLLESCNVGTAFSYLKVHRKYEDSFWLVGGYS